MTDSRDNPPTETSIEEIHAILGIDPALLAARGLRACAEAVSLAEVGPNILGQPQQLAPEAAAAWQSMRDTASTVDVQLLLVSGFRSVAEQLRMIVRRLQHNEALDAVLATLAPPGYSEHHTGCAVDIATPGARPLTSEFAVTPAFDWLNQHAGNFGFRLTYGSGNPYGFDHEPWHWCWVPD